MAYRAADIHDGRKFLWIEEAKRALAVVVTVNREIASPQYYSVLLNPEAMYNFGRALQNRDSFIINRTVEDAQGVMFRVTLHGRKVRGDHGDHDRYAITIESNHIESTGPYEVVISGRQADALGEFFRHAAAELFMVAIRSHRADKYSAGGIWIQDYDDEAKSRERD